MKSASKLYFINHVLKQVTVLIIYVFVLLNASSNAYCYISRPLELCVEQ